MSTQDESLIIDKIGVLAMQLEREAAAGGAYAEIRRTHASRIRQALDGTR